MKIRTKRKFDRVFGRMVNLRVDDVLRLEAKDAPSAPTFYSWACAWRKKEPGFSVSVWRDGNEIVILRIK